MNLDSLREELGKKDFSAEQIADAVLENPGLASVLIGALSSAAPAARLKCAKALRIISSAKPGVLYPYFDLFASLLDSKNNIIKWNAIDIIANLAAADRENRFNQLFARYYGLLEEGSLITAAHVVENSGKIARAKPELREKIAAQVLRVAEIPLPTPECRAILAGKTITAFSLYPELINDKEKVAGFVMSQLSSTRSGTRKKAESFQAKFGSR